MVSVQNLVGPRRNRARNYSILTIGYSISNFVGPMVAGYVSVRRHVTAFLAFAFFVLPAISRWPCTGR